MSQCYFPFKGTLPMTQRPENWTPALYPPIPLTLVLSTLQCKNCQRNSQESWYSWFACPEHGLSDFILNQQPAHPRILCQGTNSALSCTALSWPALSAVLGLVCILSWDVCVFCGIEHKHIQTHCCIRVLCKVHSLPTETLTSENRNLII